MPTLISRKNEYYKKHEREQDRRKRAYTENLQAGKKAAELKNQQEGDDIYSKTREWLKPRDQTYIGRLEKDVADTDARNKEESIRKEGLSREDEKRRQGFYSPENMSKMAELWGNMTGQGLVNVDSMGNKSVTKAVDQKKFMGFANTLRDMFAPEAVPEEKSLIGLWGGQQKPDKSTGDSSDVIRDYGESDLSIRKPDPNAPPVLTNIPQGVDLGTDETTNTDNIVKSVSDWAATGPAKETPAETLERIAREMPNIKGNVRKTQSITTPRPMSQKGKFIEGMYDKVSNMYDMVVESIPEYQRRKKRLG